MLGTSDDFILECLAQITEVITIPGHTDDQAAILLRVLLRGTQSSRVHHVELDVMSVELEIGPHQLDQFIQTFIVGKDLRRELLIEQRAASTGMIHLRDSRGPLPGRGKHLPKAASMLCGHLESHR